MKHEDNYMSNVDVMLEQFAQVEVPPDIQQRLNARIDEFCENPQPAMVTLPSTTTLGSRRWFVGATAAASVMFLAAAISFFALGSKDAWAQVAGALLAKPWVRFTVHIPDGVPAPEDFKAPETWFSNQHKVMACKSGDRPSFQDLARHEIRHYDPHTKSVTIESTRDEQIADFADIETLRQLVSSEGKADLSLPKSSLQVVGRIQTEVQEEGRRWTEFEFQCRNPQRSPSDFRVTVRVDPESGLPVEMRSTEKRSPNDPVTGWTLAIDYPDYGPLDIYAMGVPKDAAINDRRHVTTENGEEIKAFLAEYVKAQGKPLEPFSMTMLLSRPGTDFAEISDAIRGHDDGQGMQLEAVNPRDPIFEISRKVRLGQITQPDGTDRAAWWKEQIAGMKFTPTQEFYHGNLPNRIGYPEELTGHLTTGLHLKKGPSLIDNADIKVTLDRQPRLGPPGTVLLNIRVQTTIGGNDLFFWIAPEKDYLVLRQEIHFTKDRVAWNNLTRIIDTVEQSPKGRWYATKARYGRIKTHGDDLPKEPLPIDPRPVQDREPKEIGPVDTTMYRYIVSFTEK